MFRLLAKWWKRRVAGTRKIDPSVFGDPRALETEWTPAAPGGCNFCTHRLIQASANRVEFALTLAGKCFFLLFLLSGLGVLLLQANRIRIGAADPGGKDFWIPLLVGLVFAVVGGGLYWFGTTPRVFDRTRGAFWRSRREPSLMEGIQRTKSSVPLSAIHALQLLAEYVSGDKSSYYSYELNLVLDDASRINVVDHGNLERLRADARSLAQFLDLPLWDATQA